MFTQRDYEEYKVRINALVAKAQKTPEEGWIMQDGTPWPGNNPRDHPGMIQVVCLLLVKYLYNLLIVTAGWYFTSSLELIAEIYNTSS